jgi:hypothetical protein
MKRCVYVCSIVVASYLAAGAADLPAKSERILVQSAAFEEVAYDRKTQELTLWFDNGGVYTYREVPEATFTLFITEPSKGGFFQRHIRGRFESDCRQLASQARAKTQDKAVVSSGASCPRRSKGGAS